MEMPEVCVTYLLRERSGEWEVLLGVKKTGLGKGNVVGPGGKIEPGESPRQAAVREVHEEVGLVVEEAALTLVGEISYPFPHKPSWSQKSWIFLARDWTGIPSESEELRPSWFSVEALPLESMWDDARHWLYDVLRGGRISATFTFGKDLRTVQDWKLH